MISSGLAFNLGFLGSLDGKESTCNAGDPGSIPGLRRSPGKENGYSSILAWRTSWTGEFGGLQSMGSQRVRHDWVINTFFFSFQFSISLHSYDFTFNLSNVLVNKYAFSLDKLCFFLSKSAHFFHTILSLPFLFLSLSLWIFLTHLRSLSDCYLCFLE